MNFRPLNALSFFKRMSHSLVLMRSFWTFLNPRQKYMAFLSVMLGVHSWVRFFLNPNFTSMLALGVVHGLILWLWLSWLSPWQAHYPGALSQISPECHSFWYALDKDKQEALTKEMESLNSRLEDYPRAQSIEPFYPQVALVEAIDLHVHPVVMQSKVAVFTFAGGQATRLGTGQSKATLRLETDLLGDFSLLEYQARYFKGLKDLGFEAFWAILTSKSNHSQIQSHLEENHYFGLNPDKIDCVCQEELPLLDAYGRFWLHQDGYFLHGPDGNGSAFRSLEKEGVLGKWQRAGVEVISLNLIDNPLAYPFEFTLIEAALANPSGYSLAVIEKTDPSEKVGVLAHVRLGSDQEPRARIVEYTDLGQARAQETCDNGLVYKWASTGVMALSFETLLKLAFIDPAHKGWHLAHKKYEIATGKKIEAIKRESFIFDLFAQEGISPPLLVAYQRKDFFAPIKSLEDIPKTIAILSARDLERQKRWKAEQVDVSLPSVWSCFRWP